MPEDPQETEPAVSAAEPEEAKSKVEIVDHVAEQAKREKAAQAEDASARRATHVAALQTERDYLARTPNPNAERLAAVDAQLDEYSDAPTGRRRQTRRS